MYESHHKSLPVEFVCFEELAETFVLSKDRVSHAILDTHNKTSCLIIEHRAINRYLVAAGKFLDENRAPATPVTELRDLDDLP